MKRQISAAKKLTFTGWLFNLTGYLQKALDMKRQPGQAGRKIYGGLFAHYPPKTYHFLMTNYCNAHCIFCNQRFDDQIKKEITLDNFKIIVSHIPVAFAKCFHFSGGGEPLLSKDLFPIIKFVNESYPWIKVIIRTNGLLIDKYAQELAQSNISRLEISMHGLPQVNDYILQVNNSQAILDGIAMLNKALEEHNSKIDIEFNPVVSRLNLGEIPQLIEKAKQLKVGGVRVCFCKFFPYKKHQPKGGLKDEDSLFFHKWWYNNLIFKSKKLAKRLGVNFSFDPVFFKDLLRLKKNTCCQPWQLMLIDWDADIYPCCGGEEWFKAKVKSGRYYFGNLFKENVEQCWNNPGYLMLRKSCGTSGKGALVAECKHCHLTMSLKGPHFKHAHIIRESENS
jgi:MoaA/NifB/PqqE/SkfB family radical SAM enzyme